MLFLGAFTAWITIGDEEIAAEEYGVTETQSENTVTVMAYIASSEGQRFQIGWCDTAFKCPTRGRVSIDGRSMGGKIISESTYNKSVRKKGFRMNKDERRPFVFSKLKVTDDEILSLSSTNPGEIILVITRVRMRGTKRYDKFHAPPPAQIYNEKEVKGLDAHTTTFGAPIHETKQILYHDTEPFGDPVARFVFRYMPIDMLRARDLAPFPPRKPKRPLPSDEDEDVKPSLSTIDDLTRFSSSAPTLVDSQHSSRSVSAIREFSTSTFDSSPSRAVKRERIDSVSSLVENGSSSRSVSAAYRESSTLPFGGSSLKAVKKERLDNTSLASPLVDNESPHWNVSAANMNESSTSTFGRSPSRAVKKERINSVPSAYTSIHNKSPSRSVSTADRELSLSTFGGSSSRAVKKERIDSVPSASTFIYNNESPSGSVSAAIRRLSPSRAVKRERIDSVPAASRERSTALASASSATRTVKRERFHSIPFKRPVSRVLPQPHEVIDLTDL